MMHLRRAFGLLDQRGAATVEFAVVASAFVTLVVGGMHLSMLGFTATSLHYAAEHGARCGAVQTTVHVCNLGTECRLRSFRKRDRENRDFHGDSCRELRLSEGRQRDLLGANRVLDSRCTPQRHGVLSDLMTRIGPGSCEIGRLHSMPRVELLETLSVPARLALSCAPKTAKPAWLALLALDARLGAVLRTRREPLPAQLRLAWWRDQLEQPPASWPPGEPVLDALRCWQHPAALAALSAGWEALLADWLTSAVAAEFADARAQACAALAREFSAGDGSAAASAGRIWAAADLAAHVSHADERRVAAEFGRALPPPARLPAQLRPLAVLAALGRRALRRGGAPLLDGPGAMLIAWRAGLCGR